MALASVAPTTWLGGQAPSPEEQLVRRAANALGGRNRLLALETLQIVGYDERAYFMAADISSRTLTPRGSGRRCWSTRTIDFENSRSRVQQRLKTPLLRCSV